MQLTLSPSESPLRIIPPEPFSVDDFFRFSADNDALRCELEPNGDLTIMTPTHGSGSYLNSPICAALSNWADEDGTGFALDSSAGCGLPDGSIRSPDGAWISAARWTPPPAGDRSTIPCPDFVIELRSSTDRLKDLRAKMPTWIANGAQLAWLVDPQRKAVEIYRSGREPEIQEGHTAAYGEGPIAGFILELSRIWNT